MDWAVRSKCKSLRLHRVSERGNTGFKQADRIIYACFFLLNHTSDEHSLHDRSIACHREQASTGFEAFLESLR